MQHSVGCSGKKQREKIKVCTKMSRFLEKREIELAAVIAA